MGIRFGTDGWRDVIARDFTFANVRRVTAAIAAFLEGEGTAGRGVAVAFDRRFLSGEFAAEVAGVFEARGVPVYLAPSHLPTPALSWSVRDRGLAGGVMVTASHNPPIWNGLKFKEPFGGSARNRVSARIEELLTVQPPGEQIPCGLPGGRRTAGSTRPLDCWDSYRAGIWKLVDRDAIRGAGLRVAFDAMHGCGAPWLVRLLEEAGCEVVVLRGEANPGFGGAAPEPVETNLARLREVVLRERCALGVANDGDADRIGAVDERGRYFSPQRILAVLFRYLLEERRLTGAVARAVSATSMLDLLARRRGVQTVLTPIGFKHTGEAMLEREILIGGEESGGIGIGAHLPDRDGLLNALLLVEVVAKSGLGLRAYLQQIFEEVGYFTYERLDLQVDSGTPAGERLAGLEMDTLLGRPVVGVERMDGTKFLRDDSSWLLIRASGTEPLLRIYAEARSREEVRALIDEGRRLAEA